MRGKVLQLAIEPVAHRKIGLLEQVVYHALQAHGASVIGRVNAVYAVLVQLFNFGRQYGAAAAAKNFNVLCPSLVEQIAHVFKKFYVSALVRGNGYCLRIFLNGAIYNFLH